MKKYLLLLVLLTIFVNAKSQVGNPASKDSPNFEFVTMIFNYMHLSKSIVINDQQMFFIFENLDDYNREKNKIFIKHDKEISNDSCVIVGDFLVTYTFIDYYGIVDCHYNGAPIFDDNRKTYFLKHNK